MGLWITGDPKADRLLEDDPFALLIGMLLDQQVPMETAFAGPLKLADRMGGLDPARIADASPDEFAALCATPPAVHRFPGSMAGRIQAVVRTVVDDHDGDVTRLWRGGDPDGREVLRRLKALPGFGEQKAKIFLALLGKQRGIQPAGWMPRCLPRRARKILAFCSPKPGRAFRRRSTSRPSGSPPRHRRVTSPSWSSTTVRTTAWMRPAIEPGNRCTAGGVAHSAANSSGEASAIRAGSRPPIRSASLSGPAKAVSIGTCWSRSIPISRANGSSSRRRSALGSPVIHSPIAPWCHPRRRVAPRRAQENVSTGRPVTGWVSTWQCTR